MIVRLWLCLVEIETALYDCTSYVYGIILTSLYRGRDFLESLDDGSFFSQPPAVTPSLMSSPTYANTVSLGVDNPYITQPPVLPPPTPSNTNPSPATQEGEKPAHEPAPVVLPAPSKTERFFLTAADQASGSRNERLNMVIRSKYEAGLLKPYNYVKGYARLSRWMDRK